jgi:hypothetical protein
VGYAVTRDELRGLDRAAVAVLIMMPGEPGKSGLERYGSAGAMSEPGSVMRTATAGFSTSRGYVIAAI